MCIYTYGMGSGPRRPIGDVQTDVHIVPVDSDSPSRNLLKVQTVRCALVLYKGNYIPSPAPNLNIKGPWTGGKVTISERLTF